MKNKQVLLLLTLIAAISWSGCKQLQGLANLSKCEFRLKSIENINLSGVNVQNVKSLSDLTVVDAARLTSAVLSNNFPLSFTLNMDVRNPNPAPASLTKLDWILNIDNIDLVSGTTQNRLQVAPNGGLATYPLLFNFNLREVLKEKTGQALINFALNLAGAGNQPSRVILKAKPYVNIGNIQLPYPSYINIKNEFTSN